MGLKADAVAAAHEEEAVELLEDWRTQRWKAEVEDTVPGECQEEAGRLWSVGVCEVREEEARHSCVPVEAGGDP